jgi:hypothetical protein
MSGPAFKHGDKVKTKEPRMASWFTIEKVITSTEGEHYYKAQGPRLYSEDEIEPQNPPEQSKD